MTADLSRRRFLGILGIATAGLIVAPEIQIQRIWALGAPETATGIAVMKMRCYIRVSNELIQDCAPMLDQLLRRMASESLGVKETEIQYRKAAPSLSAFENKQTWFQAVAT
jgi:hypothetical protein